MRDVKYDIARSFAMVWVVGIYHLSEYVFTSPLHESQWARMVTWGCLGAFTFISAYFLAGKYEFANWMHIRAFYKKRLIRFYPLFIISALSLFLIGFNDWEQTWRGLIGISTFSAPQINTLWYISMLMGFYLLTPFMSRGGIFYKLIIYLLIVGIVVLLKMFHAEVDNRFFYYLTIYEAGIIFSKHIPIRLQKQFYVSNLIFIMGCIIYTICLLWVVYHPNILCMMIGGFIGCGLLLLISERIANTYNFSRLINFFSYGSMAAYLFHRQIFYIGLSVYDPTDMWKKIIYLVAIVLPIIFIISYYIQRYYDRLIIHR